MKPIKNEKLKGNPKKSARYIALGTVKEKDDYAVRLADKIIYPINICPFCRSKETFHRRMQEGHDVIGNVWRFVREQDDISLVTKKYDFCLRCGQEFIIEVYCWEKLKGSKE